MSVAFALASAAKDLRRLSRDPAAFAIWLGIPILVGALVTVAFGGRGGPEPQAHLLVADLDDSFVSNLLLGAFGQGELAELIRTEPVSEADGRARLDEGDASALLVIPEGFADALLAEQPVALELVKNPAQRILPEIVEEVLGTLPDAVFYVQRLVGDDLRALAAGPADGAVTFSDEIVARISVRVNEIVGRLGTWIFPPAIVLSLAAPAEETGDESPGEESLALLFLPGLLFMSILFMAQGLSTDVWQEHEQRTLRRVLVAPRGVGEFLAGKLASGGVVILLVSGVALGVGYAWFRLEWASYALALVWATFSGVGLLAGMTLLQLLCGSQRAGSILTMAITFPLIMAGGSFFPFEAMPEWMQRIGRLTPNGWALEQLKAIVLDRVQPGALAFAGLLVVGVVLFAASGHRLRTAFAGE